MNDLKTVEEWQADVKAAALAERKLREEALDLARQRTAEALAVAKQLAEALDGLRYKDEPERLCDHAAAPCRRCDAATAALSAHEKLLEGK